MQATRVLRARGRTTPKLAWTLRAVPSPLLASLPELLASAYDGAEVVSTSAAYATAQVSFPKASANTFQKDVASSGGLTLDGHLVHAAPYAPGRAADSPEDGTRVLVMGLPRGRVVHALRSQLPADAAAGVLGVHRHRLGRRATDAAVVTCRDAAAAEAVAAAAHGLPTARVVLAAADPDSAADAAAAADGDGVALRAAVLRAPFAPDTAVVRVTGLAPDASEADVRAAVCLAAPVAGAAATIRMHPRPASKRAVSAGGSGANVVPFVSDGRADVAWPHGGAEFDGAAAALAAALDTVAGAPVEAEATYQLADAAEFGAAPPPRVGADEDVAGDFFEEQLFFIDRLKSGVMRADGSASGGLAFDRVVSAEDAAPATMEDWDALLVGDAPPAPDLIEAEAPDLVRGWRRLIARRVHLIQNDLLGAYGDAEHDAESGEYDNAADDAASAAMLAGQAPLDEVDLLLTDEYVAELNAAYDAVYDAAHAASGGNVPSSSSSGGDAAEATLETDDTLRIVRRMVAHVEGMHRQAAQDKARKQQEDAEAEDALIKRYAQGDDVLSAETADAINAAAADGFLAGDAAGGGSAADRHLDALDALDALSDEVPLSAADADLGLDWGADDADEDGEDGAEAAAEEDDEWKDWEETAMADKWAECVVSTTRTMKVVKGGTILRFRALVTVGNGRGAGGYGVGKGNSPGDAVAKASKQAKRNAMVVDRYLKGSLVHSVAARVNGCKVVITATAPGSGGRGNPMCTEILESMGVVDFSAKAFGRRSPLAVVQATYKALKKHRGIDDMTRGRGLRLVPFDAAARRGV